MQKTSMPLHGTNKILFIDKNIHWYIFFFKFTSFERMQKYPENYKVLSLNILYDTRKDKEFTIIFSLPK